MPEVSCTNNTHELSMATFMTDAQKRRAETVAEAMAKKVKTTPSTPKTLATAVIKITQIPQEFAALQHRARGKELRTNCNEEALGGSFYTG
jgi:serine protease inhibitor ecotin